MVRVFAHGTMGTSDRSFIVDPLSYFSFQPVLHDWCNKGRGMCYPVCGMMHIKEPLLLIGKSSLCGGSGFPLSLSEWTFIMRVSSVGPPRGINPMTHCTIADTPSWSYTLLLIINKFSDKMHYNK